MTKTEVKILQILWSNDSPLCAYDIIHSHPELKEITVRTTLANLLNKNLIRVEGMVHRTKSYARTFVANISPEKVYINSILNDNYTNLFAITKAIITENRFTNEQKQELFSLLTNLHI